MKTIILKARINDTIFGSASYVDGYKYMYSEKHIYTVDDIIKEL
ncbi:MAG: hypothetical protein RR630_02515 [Coprobacillus sp.]